MEEDISSWWKQANCLDEDPDLFFPGPGDLNKIRDAKAICKGCDVRVRCREYALNHPKERGIWGGMTERERDRERRRRRAANARQDQGELSA